MINCHRTLSPYIKKLKIPLFSISHRFPFIRKPGIYENILLKGKNKTFLLLMYFQSTNLLRCWIMKFSCKVRSQHGVQRFFNCRVFWSLFVTFCNKILFLSYNFHSLSWWKPRSNLHVKNIYCCVKITSWLTTTRFIKLIKCIFLYAKLI